MKIIEGNISSLPTTVHVEQDGNYFFVLPTNRDTSSVYVAPLAVLDVEQPVGFDLDSAKAAQDVVRALLVARGVDASFDY